MRIRLAQQGEVGPGGGTAGDLYVEIHERPHDVYSRKGDDLQPVGMRVDDRQRALADRAGRSENRDPFHASFIDTVGRAF